MLQDLSNCLRILWPFSMEFTRHFGGDLRILGLNEKIAQLEAFEIKLNEWKLNLIGLNEKIAEPNLV